MEQKEKNRNIPRKSVKKNNYSSRWNEEYRNRGFDERGYRNLTSERGQPYESKRWAVGGTGVLTACVRDMTRSEHILEREQQDLAFEVSLAPLTLPLFLVELISLYVFLYIPL